MYNQEFVGNLAQQVGEGMVRTHQNIESVFMKYGTLMEISLITHYERMCLNIVYRIMRDIIDIYSQIMSFQNHDRSFNPTFPKDEQPITISLSQKELVPAYTELINELYELRKLCLTKK